MLKIIDDKNFDNSVLKSNKLVLVDFWAEWCGPCKGMLPVVEDVADEMSEKVDFYKMNVDDNPETPGQYQIRAIPTYILFKDGRNIATEVGVLSRDAFASWIKKHL